MRIEWTELDGQLFTFHHGVRIQKFADLFSVHIVDSTLLPTGKTVELHSLGAAYEFIERGKAVIAPVDQNEELRKAILNVVSGMSDPMNGIAENIDLLSPSELRDFNRALNSFTSVVHRFENRINNRQNVSA